MDFEKPLHEENLWHLVICGNCVKKISTRHAEAENDNKELLVGS